MTGVTSYSFFHAMSGWFLLAVMVGSIAMAFTNVGRGVVLFYRNIILQALARINLKKDVREAYRSTIPNKKHLAMSIFFVTALIGSSYIYKSVAGGALLTAAAIESRTQNDQIYEFAKYMSGGDFNTPIYAFSGSKEMKLRGYYDFENNAYLMDGAKYVTQGSLKADKILQAPLIFMSSIANPATFVE